MGAESFASATANVGKNVLNDEKFLKAAGKIGKRTLTAAGITRKTTFTRRTKFDTAGAMKAIQNPTETGLLAANQLRKDAPRIAFHLGRATVGAIFKQRQEAAAPVVAESYTEPSADASAPAVAQEGGVAAAQLAVEQAHAEMAEQAQQAVASHEYPLAR